MVIVIGGACRLVKGDNIGRNATLATTTYA
jgi:hypothetical protein